MEKQVIIPLKEYNSLVESSESNERILKKVEGKIIIEPMEYERLKSYEHKNIKAVTLIYDFCETCSSHDECPEEECMLFQVEQCLIGSDNE